jgi:hypothetical protein
MGSGIGYGNGAIGIELAVDGRCTDIDDFEGDLAGRKSEKEKRGWCIFVFVGLGNCQKV